MIKYDHQELIAKIEEFLENNSIEEFKQNTEELKSRLQKQKKDIDELLITLDWYSTTIIGERAAGALQSYTKKYGQLRKREPLHSLR